MTAPNPPTPSGTGLIAAVDALDEAADRRWGAVFRGRPLADRVFYVASEIGDFSVIWLIIGAAEGLRSDEDADAALRLGALLLAESAIVNQGIKRLVRRPRPEATGARPHNVRKPQTSSFPSGHASSAMFAATLLGRRHPRRAPLYYGIGAIVATSRVHVKVHHASDVVAGAIVGRVLAMAAERIWPSPTTDA